MTMQRSGIRKVKVLQWLRVCCPWYLISGWPSTLAWCPVLLCPWIAPSAIPPPKGSGTQSGIYNPLVLPNPLFSWPSTSTFRLGLLWWDQGEFRFCSLPHFSSPQGKKPPSPVTVASSHARGCSNFSAHALDRITNACTAKSNWAPYDASLGALEPLWFSHLSLASVPHQTSFSASPNHSQR